MSWLLPVLLLLVQEPKPRYETRERHDPNGIGKFYLGREIAHVMGHEGIGWLERPEREAEEAPKMLIAALGLKPGHVVADIGAGSGYFSFRMAPKVAPEGKVLAVDIQPEMLDFLRRRSRELGIANVEPVLGATDDPKLPAGGVDLALMVDVYHEFDQPYEMMSAIVRSLRPGGRVVLVEYRKEDPRVPIKEVHKMSEAQARKEMEAAGLAWVQTIDILPRQHILIFTPAAVAAGARPPEYTERLRRAGVAFDLVGVPGAGDLKPFWIGRTEVTWQEWLAYATDASEESLGRLGLDGGGFPSTAPPFEHHRFMGDFQPAVGLTQHGAREYCRWLGARTGKRFRLPTEAEWEHAARAGGTDPRHERLDAAAWHSANSGGRTHQVGQKEPNGWGLRDALGNAAEYCEGRPPVSRGGGWSDSPLRLSTGLRQPDLESWNDAPAPPGFDTRFYWATPLTGLRVVREFP
jgi:SAM-dependent methyltransferase